MEFEKLQEMIDKRKSVRKYTGEPVDDATVQKILDFIADTKPLYPDIRVCSEIVGRESVKSILPWLPPQILSIYSEDKDGAPENIGFIYQQLDLYLQSIGLGACWVGMCKPDEKKGGARESADGLKFVMMIAFGYPKGNGRRKSVSEFKRKSLFDISDRADDRLRPAALAPSSINSQPWYFVHEGDTIHVYCVQQGLLKKKVVSGINLLDTGIALAHLYVSYPDAFRFFRADAPTQVKNYQYVGSLNL